MDSSHVHGLAVERGRPRMKPQIIVKHRGMEHQSHEPLGQENKNKPGYEKQLTSFHKNEI
jgi:hypothetical protein